jgi:hypothetical protein
MKKEKTEALKSIQDACGSKGCGPECCVDLEAIRARLHDQCLGDEDLVFRSFARLLEWDHNDPLKKCKNVSKITNKALRLAEIKICTLRCMFCHRLKTYQYGDGYTYDIEPGQGRITRADMRKYLKLKQKRLNSPKNNGSCAGDGTGGVCSFAKALSDIQKNNSASKFRNGLEWDILILLLYDFDHDDPGNKLGSVWAHGETEAEKCTIRCCMCHGVKTVKEGEYNHWIIVDEDDNEIEVASGSLDEEPDECEERGDMEFRVESL